MHAVICVRLLSLSIMFLRFIHVVVCINLNLNFQYISYLIRKCNMSQDEVYIVYLGQSHPFINLGVILASTLLAIHIKPVSNPIIWSPPFFQICPLHSHCHGLSTPSVPRFLQKPKVPAPSPSSPAIQNLHCTNRACVNAHAFTPSAASHRQRDMIPHSVRKVPPCPLPLLLRWLLGNWVSSQTSVHPSKLLIAHLVWTVPWRIPSHSPHSFQHLVHTSTQLLHCMEIFTYTWQWASWG